MEQQDLVALLQSVSMDELKKVIPAKERMEKLEKRKMDLEKELASVDKQIASLLLPSGMTPIARAKTKKSPRRAKRRRIAQPSLSSLVVEILQERKKALGINDICYALLKEKNYRTRAKNFKAQIRVMMYRNEKGLFKKAGPGLFKLTSGAKPKTKAATMTKAKAKAKTKKKAKRKPQAKVKKKGKVKTRPKTRAKRKTKTKAKKRAKR